MSFQLPEWIEAQTWNDYEEMRRKIKKPLTERAREIAVKKLLQLRSQGFSVEEVLEQSIFNSWQGLFEVRGQEPRRPDYEYGEVKIKPHALENERLRRLKEAVH